MFKGININKLTIWQRFWLLFQRTNISIDMGYKDRSCMVKYKVLRDKIVIVGVEYI